MVSWITRAAMEFVGLAALGQSFDPLTEDAKEHPYVTALKLLGYAQKKPSSATI